MLLQIFVTYVSPTQIHTNNEPTGHWHLSLFKGTLTVWVIDVFAFAFDLNLGWQNLAGNDGWLWQNNLTLLGFNPILSISQPVMWQHNVFYGPTYRQYMFYGAAYADLHCWTFTHNPSNPFCATPFSNVSYFMWSNPKDSYNIKVVCAASLRFSCFHYGYFNKMSCCF